MNNKILKEGLTYDDVLVVPSYSEVLPHMVDVSTRFTKNIILNIPVVSAAMDTVTESKMAIAIAQEGGIGVLHKNMSIAKQALEVRRVKRSESGMILDPIILEISNKFLAHYISNFTRDDVNCFSEATTYFLKHIDFLYFHLISFVRTVYCLCSS